MILIKLLFVTAILYSGPILGQQECAHCAKKFMDLSLVKYRAQNIRTESIAGQYMASNALRVLWEYQFNCSSANITSLILGIKIRRVTNSRMLFPSVQVFTPNGSQYDLVAGSERIIYYTTSNVSTNGMVEYPLDPPIKVMNGDVLAISQPFAKTSVVRVYYINGINFSSSMEYLIGSKNIDSSNFLISNELILVYPVTSGYCVNSTNSITAAFIKEKALEIQRSQPFYYLSQYIYPQIVFSCNGSVTKWIFGAYSMGSLSQPELQIWRQLGPNNYNKTGSSLINATNMIGPNLYEFIPQVPLQFQEGDMFGVYSNNMVNGDSLILYEQRESGPMNLRIGPRLDSPLSTIVSLKLYQVTNDYPLVTAEISQSTGLEESSITEYSKSPYPSQLIGLSVSGSWLIGGIVGAITIISIASILVLACIIVFIKKRVNLHNNADYSIIETRKDDTKKDDTLIMNDMTSITPMQDNSAYGSTHDAAINESSAHDSYSDDTYLYMSNDLYATVDEVKQDQDDDPYI